MQKAQKYKPLPQLWSNSLNLSLSVLLIVGALALQVSVKFFTALREITGKKEETLTFKDSKTVTIDVILRKLIQRYGKSFREYVFDGKTGEVKSFLQFLVNGRSMTETELGTKLEDGDVLAIIPPVGGG